MFALKKSAQDMQERFHEAANDASFRTNWSIKGAAASALVLASQMSHAAFTVPTEITDATTSVGLIGAAVFAIAVGIKLYKWLRRAL